MPEQLFAQPEDILKQPEVNYITVGKIKYASYTPPSHPDSHYLQAAAGIAASFLAFRWLMSVGLNAENVRRRQEADEAIRKIQDLATPDFLAAVEPHVHLAAAVVNNRIEENYARAYSEQLSSYISETSAQALLEGYTAATNAGIDSARSWEIAASGYGLDSVQMRQYVMAAIRAYGETKPGYNTQERLKPEDMLLQKLIESRAAKIGENESFAAAQLSTIISYQASEYRGEAEGGIRRWETAQDERVCPVCGPLDGVEMGMFEPFSVNGKLIWAPGVHPNCRCSVSILYPASTVSKAMGSDPFDRDAEGKFATRESRRMAMTIDPEVATEIINDLKQVTSPFVTTQATSPFVTNKVTAESSFKTNVFTPADTSVFAPADTSVFTPAKVSAFTTTSTSVFTPAKQQQTVIIVNGIQMRRMTKAEAGVDTNIDTEVDTEVDTKVETDFGADLEPYPVGDPLWMFGTHITDQFDARGGDLRIGSTIDFDQIQPIDQDSKTGDYMHYGYMYASAEQVDPRALAFASVSAQSYISEQNQVYEESSLSNLDSGMTQTVYDYIDNEVAYQDIGDLVEVYGTSRGRLVHIFENYLDGVGKKSASTSLDEITLDKFKKLSEEEMGDALIEISYMGPKDEEALKMAFGNYIAGYAPEIVREELGVYSEGSSMSSRDIDTLFKFQGFNGYKVESDMGFDSGEVVGKYEIVSIDLESDLRPADIQEANTYMGGNASLMPDEWRVVTLRPIGDYDPTNYRDYEPPDDYKISW